MRALLSGGGTAGHVYPALTVAAELSADGHSVVFVGTGDGLEARLVPEAGIEFLPLPARGFDRGRPLSMVSALFVLAASVVRAWRLVGRWRPDVVVGFGGYVSLPVGLAAVARGIPVVLHEQNSVPGMANKALSRWARRVAVTYAASASWMKHADRVIVTGNPVRAAVVGARSAEGRATLGLPPDALVLLVFGGSRGARHLNSATLALWPRLATVPRLQVVHAAGSMDVARVRDDPIVLGAGEAYRLVEYLDDMGSALAAADLVVARAGATSIAEITTLGRPSVLVPYPYATDDHQTKNALEVASAGACVTVADSELDSDVFGDAVLRLLENDDERRAMARASAALGRPDAGHRVAQLAIEAATAR